MPQYSNPFQEGQHPSAMGGMVRGFDIALLESRRKKAEDEKQREEFIMMMMQRAYEEEQEAEKRAYEETQEAEERKYQEGRAEVKFGRQKTLAELAGGRRLEEIEARGVQRRETKAMPGAPSGAGAATAWKNKPMGEWPEFGLTNVLKGARTDPYAYQRAKTILSERPGYEKMKPPEGDPMALYTDAAGWIRDGKNVEEVKQAIAELGWNPDSEFFNNLFRKKSYEEMMEMMKLWITGSK